MEKGRGRKKQKREKEKNAISLKWVQPDPTQTHYSSVVDMQARSHVP